MEVEGEKGEEDEKEEKEKEEEEEEEEERRAPTTLPIQKNHAQFSLGMSEGRRERNEERVEKGGSGREDKEKKG